MTANSCNEAVKYIETSENRYGRNDKLLFLMDSAMINMLCGNYDAGNKYFKKAEYLGEELWTKSVSQYTLSMVSNDMAISYAGEDFERALINLFSAICYAKLGEFDEALVECRRLDTLLSGYNAVYQKKNVYKEDAFGRYLSGIIHEAGRDLDDAFIDYYAAFKSYRDYNAAYGTPLPSFLPADLLRTAAAVDRLDEARHLLSSSSVEYRSMRETMAMGKIIFIHLNGQSPVKVEKKFTVPTPSGPISIAFPGYKVNPVHCRQSKFVVESGSFYFEKQAELVEDINKIAVKCLDDRKGREIAKAIARAVLKQAAIKTISREVVGKDKKDPKRKEKRQLFEFVANMVNTFALEKADIRTWRTLPGEIYLSRTFVPPGPCRVSVKQCGGTQNMLESMNIKAGETRFVVFRSIY